MKNDKSKICAIIDSIWKCALISLVASVAFSCGGPETEYSLPSGKRISIISKTRMEFPSGPPALVLDYETTIPMENKGELRKEVDEVWEVFRKEVVLVQMDAAAIRPTQYDANWILRLGTGYGFVFLKRPDGSWYCLDDRKNYY